MESCQSSAPSQPSENRRFERYDFRAVATATILPVPIFEGEPQECFVMTRDLSRGGLSFLHPKRLAIGQQIELSFDDGREFAVNVRWIEQLEKRKFLIGCGFLKTGRSS